jgi:hypothetical protein
MKPSGPLCAAAAAAILSASGCDYWDNLVTQKAVTKVSLSVATRDAWTGEALAEVACEDSARGLEFTTDGAGNFKLEAAGTGRYSLACRTQWYYDARAEFEATGTGAAQIVKFARKGGNDWYPDAGRRVEIPAEDGPIRFPRKLAWTASPTDTAGAFRYAWEFRRCGRLSQGLGQGPGEGPVESKSLLPNYGKTANTDNGVQPGQDTVVLRVFSRLNKALGEYEAGSDTLFVDWVKNKLPTVELSRPSGEATYKVGCGQNAPRLYVKIKSSDQDGILDSVRLFVKDPTLSLGHLDTSVAWHDSITLSLPLTAPNPPVDLYGDHRLEFDNILFAEVIDENGEKVTDSVPFMTYSNILPTAQAGLMFPARTVYFVGDSVRVWIRGHDSDGSVDKLSFFWDGDGKDDFTVENRPTNDAEWNYYHKFTQAQKLMVIDSWTTDNCGGTGHAWIPLEVRKNTAPNIVFTSPRKVKEGDTTFHEFDLTVNDEDVDANLDSLTRVKIYWGDGIPQTKAYPKGVRPITETQHHVYTNSPPKGATAFEIRIEVSDAHAGGTAYLDTTLAY